MAECLNEQEVELSLGLAIGSGGRLRKCSDVGQKNQNDGVLGRQETRKKQEVRRGTVCVDEDVVDARVRKRMKSEFRLESGVDEGDVSFCSVDGESLSSPQKCSRGTTNNAAAGVKERIACSRGFNSHIDEKVIGPSSLSPPPAVVVNLNGQCMSSQALMADKEGAERSLVLPFVPLAKMPCVSTTGSGPSGTTVRGFLYRYTKEEVCIVCVCHGFLFSPAKFVEHAGGRNVENPLRHITVTPFPSPGP